MSSYARFACISLLFILVISSTTIAGTADDDKPYIFINTASHYKYLGTNTSFKDFADIARKVGFRIEHGVHPQLHGGVLDGIDVYMLYEPNIPLVGDNLIALRQWIREGGILLGCSFSDTLKGLMSEWGVDFAIANVVTVDLKIPAGSPLNGPNKINILSTQIYKVLEIFDKTKSEAILNYDDGKAAMTRTLRNTGKGEIIAIGCCWVIHNEGDSDRADNPKLVENLLIYIRDKIKGTSSDGDGFDLTLNKLKTKGSGSFVPGEEIKFVAKIRNIGTQLSEETRIAFYIERVGAAPSAKIEITSATVNQVQAKKKIKIVRKTFLPDDLATGTYEVSAIIDPDELTDEAKTSNNGATAKKKIIIQ